MPTLASFLTCWYEQHRLNQASLSGKGGIAVNFSQALASAAWTWISARQLADGPGTLTAGSVAVFDLWGAKKKKTQKTPHLNIFAKLTVGSRCTIAHFLVEEKIFKGNVEYLFKKICKRVLKTNASASVLKWWQWRNLVPEYQLKGCF